MLSPRERINIYLSAYNADEKCPLEFYKYSAKKAKETPSIEDMILRVLELTKKYHSFNPSIGAIETDIGKYRSAIDIWRHIIYFFPDISIYDVMMGIRNLWDQKKINGHYCTTINRRVFWPLHDWESKYFSDLMSRTNMYSYSGRRWDEFELEWDEWRDIK